MTTDPQRTLDGWELRLSPAGWELAVCIPGRDPWCVDLATMRARYRTAAAVSGWTPIATPPGQIEPALTLCTCRQAVHMSEHSGRTIPGCPWCAAAAGHDKED